MCFILMNLKRTLLKLVLNAKVLFIYKEKTKNPKNPFLGKYIKMHEFRQNLSQLPPFLLKKIAQNRNSYNIFENIIKIFIKA